jgi:molybdate transport system ATP-binding protein
MITASFRGRIGQFQLDASFSVPSQGVTALFGPSGCGKTSILRCIAGLQRVAEGSCVVDGDVWQGGQRFIPTHRRPIGMVFQEASLFAHLDVRRNLLYGAPSPMPPGAVGLDEVVGLLGLARLLDRSPHHLSGGERQRVAMGRALLSQPRLLLLDEPLSALDHTGKNEVLQALERLHAALSLPIILVSHDRTEVERLADHLVLLEAGRVVASGAISEVQSDIRLPFAGSTEAAISLDAVVSGYDDGYGLTRFEVEGATLLVPAPSFQPGSTHRLRIAARDVSLALPPQPSSTISNILPAVILERRDVGTQELIVALGLGVDGHGARLLARVTRRSWYMLSLMEGQAVLAQIKAVALVAGTETDRHRDAEVSPASPPFPPPDSSE